jgi:hypothetical protein
VRGRTERLQDYFYTASPGEGHLDQCSKETTIRAVMIREDEILFVELLGCIKEVFEQVD